MKRLLKFIMYFVLSPFIIRKGDSGAIYITFDDGPNINTIEILNILKHEQVIATFFMVGEEMIKYPDIVYAIIKAGHSLAYHSYSHNSLKKLSYHDVILDFKKASILEKKFNIKFKLYRPPYGDLTIFSILCLIIYRWKIIMWSLDSGDSFYTKEKVLDIVDPKNISDGDILLFHDDYALTVDILPKILKRISENNIVSRGL